MDMGDLISIILPIYNVEKYLDKCMRSVMNQTYHNLEIIMVDDGSTDSCPFLCDEYAKKDFRITVYHKENGGLSDARNYGIEKANGEYITCIDSDDYVDGNYIEYLYTLLKKYKSKMAICQHRVLYNNGAVKENSICDDELITNKDCIERMLYHDIIDTSAWAKLYHRSLFENVRYPKGRLFEDISTTYALMLQCPKIAVGYEAKYNYIYHDNSIVNGAFNLKKLDLIDMTDEMAKNVLAVYPDLRQAVIRRQVYARFSTLNQMLNTSEYEEKRKELISYIKAHKKEVQNNPKTPRRDKVAITLLDIGYGFYRFVWLTYRKRIMNTKG